MVLGARRRSRGPHRFRAWSDSGGNASRLGLVYSIAILVLGMNLGLETTLALTITVMAATFATRILVVQSRIPSAFLGHRV